MPTHIPLKTALPTAVAVCVMLALFAVQAGLTLRPTGVPRFGVQYPHLAYGYQSSAASSSLSSSSSSSAPACSFTDGFEDQTLAPFTTNGDAAWTIDNVAFAGSFGALSGVIGSEEETVLHLTQTVETGGATLSFRVKVSSEATFDTLTFIVNGVEEETYSGEVDWTLFSMVLPAGEHTLAWKYAKDADGVSGSDSAWIDAVSISNTVCGSCGDSVVNAGETCDDGGDGAMCDNDCTEPLCGDGHRNAAAGEACDDGDADNGDGCSSSCTVETGFSCSGTDPDSCSATCGDGVKASSEACDDGNVQLGDGCSTSCTVESGFSCSGTSPSTCSATCGDGIVAGDETCDDGDADSGDGCSSSCQEENGYACTGEPSSCIAVCGDGVLVDGVEACDDGDTDSGDGCSSSCTVETGFSCGGEPSSCSSTCGDGIRASDEACDDGDTDNGDGCSSSCTVESGFACIGSAPSICSADCGDGVLASAEECDDGDIASGDGCSDSCEIEEGFSCSDEPSSCTGICGDGLQVAEEECDDGDADSGDGCSSSCQEENGYACTGEPSSCIAVCGDGVLVDGVEACDDGDTDSGDGCSAACQEEAGFTCSGEPSSCTGICGDGLQVAGEACDDGNQSNTDACLNSCQLATCGDTFVRAGVEECEPPGFGTCSMSCTEQVGIGGSTGRVSESTVIIRNTLQLRSNPLCGNGVVDPDEECDPSARGVGGADPNCSQTCTRNFCGDGIVQAGRGEECEPLQNADGDFVIPLCGSACTYPLCDDDGDCSGGCRLVVRRSCTVTLPSVPAGDSSSPSALTGLPASSSVPASAAMIGREPGTGASAARSLLAPAAPSVPNTASSATAVRLPVGASSLSLRFTPDPPPSLLPMSASSRSFSGGSSSARSALPAAAFCGNGMREGAEECDDGFANADDTPDACRTDCTLPRCGDGVTDTAELCDDGNTFNGDGCTSVCTAAVCGNGFLEAGEECDDGERAGRRFSLRFNADEPGFCRTNCLLPRCGDGITDGAFGEECDDGESNSMTDPDRCRTNCLLPRCGDGIVDTDEECDDGNADDGDACGNDCRLSVCGDGSVDAAEQCDDGNTLSGDGCSERCQEERPAAPEEERGFLAFLRRVVRVFVSPFR